MNTIVKYHNDFNNAYPLCALTKSEDRLLNLLFLSLYDKRNSTMNFSFDEIAQKLELSKKNPAFIYDFLKAADEKFKDYRFHDEIETPNSSRPIYARVELFPTFIINPNTQLLTVSLNKDYEWLLNDLMNEYTAYLFSEYEKLNNTYAQILFRQIKRWRVCGKLIFDDIDKFRLVFGISEKCRNCDLMYRVIKPAVNEIKELNGSIKGLECESLYEGKEHKLIGFKFTWKAERKKITESNDKNKNLTSVMFKLKDQKITEDEYQELISKYEKEDVDYTINRIINKPYIGCLTKEKIAQWCDEAKNKNTLKKQNAFKNFNERQNDFDALEKKLFGY